MLRKHVAISSNKGSQRIDSAQVKSESLARKIP
jgi:hypothetical protein